MLNRETFAQPPSTFRPMPFWFWNSKIRPEQVEKQILDFHEKGLGGFFIHARFGLETEYLSREWMDCIRKAIETAASVGLEVWLYDENGFPSGIGDLKVSRIREYRPKFVSLTEDSADPQGIIRTKVPQGDVLLAYAFSPDTPNVSHIDMKEHIRNGLIEWKAPSPDWKVAVFVKGTIEDANDVVYGVDYLSVEAMRYFFDTALVPYEEALGKYFGNVIKGIFTDEPTLLPWHHNGMWYCQRDNARLVPWNDAIAEDMNSLHNLTIAEFLPHIFYDLDSATGQIRRLFQKSTVNLYMRSFFLPYKEWCEKHSLKLTGHMLLEEGLYYNTIFESDPYPTLSMMDIPGTDHLSDVTEHGYYGMPNVPVVHTNITGRKLASSTAHMSGKTTVISESFGCAGWGLTPERTKLMTDWQYSLGINMLCPHAIFYSIEGYRKNDAPPAHNYLPSWQYHRTFTDYVGRISYALRQGIHKARVALYYPIQAFQSAYAPEVDGGDARRISDGFDACCSLLPRLHLDYDIISDKLLAGCSVSDGHLYIAGETFDVLVAHSSAIRSGTRKLVEEFMSGGGRAVIITTAPGFQNLSGATHIAAQDLSYDELLTALKTLLTHQIPAEPKITAIDGGSSEDIRCHIRACENQQVFFLTNVGETKIKFTIWTQVEGLCELWDPETGKVSNASEVASEAGGIKATIELGPCESTILAIDETKASESLPVIVKSRREVYTFPDEWTFSTLSPNVIPLNEWKLQMGSREGTQTMSYTTKFDCEYMPDKLELMLDDIEYRSSLMGSMNITIRVNKTLYEKPDFGWFLDDGFKTLDISDAVIEGSNELCITIAHSAWAGQPQFLNGPAFLLGRFGCSRDRNAIIPPYDAAMCGSWTEFGYPFYSGSADYSQSFRVKKMARNSRLLVCVEDVNDCVEVLIDGKQAGVRLWRPWEVDITDMVTNNRSTLTLRVSNSMLNLLSLTPKSSGLMGSVKLVSVV